MDSTQTIFWMAVACLVFIGLLIFAKPLKVLVRIMVQGVLGCIGIFLMNFLMGSFGVSVGINILTAFIIGVLGLPGFVLLYAAGFVLH